MIRVVLADDEQLSRRRLASFLSDYPEYQIIGEAVNGEEAIAQTNKLKPDVLFLDIQMPKGDGFEVISGLSHNPVIIFATAFDDYALNAFEVHALDYLLKPYSKDRFARTVNLIKKILKDPEDYNRRTMDALMNIHPGQNYLQRVSVRDKHTFTIIPVEKISSITITEGLVYINSGRKKYQCDASLNQFEHKLDPQLFMRIHRSAIVNLERITCIMPWGQGRFAVQLDDETSIQVSRERIKKFREQVGLKF